MNTDSQPLGLVCQPLLYLNNQKTPKIICFNQNGTVAHLYQCCWVKGCPNIYRSSLEQVSSKIILALRFHGSDANTPTPFPSYSKGTERDAATPHLPIKSLRLPPETKKCNYTLLSG